MARARTIKRVGVLEGRPGDLPRATGGSGRNPVAQTRGAGRSASVTRKTKETQIELALNVDGSGRYDISTGVPFLNHVLELFTRHGFFDLTIRATGDIEVDDHHTVEDVGLTLGQAFKQALGGKEGIRRFGEATVPLDEALINVVVDLSGRPYLAYDLKTKQNRIGTFDVELIHDFLLAFANENGMNLHVRMLAGRNPHHIVEATFKGMARALDLATQRDPRVEGVLSTKGTLSG
jgi:imidazoleglycerol-phosphate dehydratase